MRQASLAFLLLLPLASAAQYKCGYQSIGAQSDNGNNLEGSFTMCVPTRVSTVTDVEMYFGTPGTGNWGVAVVDTDGGSSGSGNPGTVICSAAAGGAPTGSSWNILTPSSCNTSAGTNKLPALHPFWLARNFTDAATTAKFDTPGGAVPGYYFSQACCTFVNYPGSPSSTGPIIMSEYLDLVGADTPIFTIARANIATSNAGGSLPTVNTTGSTLWVVGMNSLSSMTPPTDNLSNSWTCLTQYSVSGTLPFVQLCYVIAPTTSSSTTIAIPNGPGFAAFYAYDNTAHTWFLQSGSDKGAHCTSCLSLSPGTVTPLSANALIVTEWADSGTDLSTLTIPSGYVNLALPILVASTAIYTDLTEGNQGGGSGPNGGFAYLENAPPSPSSPTWTETVSGGSPNQAAAMAVFLSSPPVTNTARAQIF